MIFNAVGFALLASDAGAAPRETLVRTWVCGQTNPTEDASFALRFRTDGSLGTDRPISATLVDRQTHEVAVRSGAPARTPDEDLEDHDTWRIGRDLGGTVYLLTLPRGELGLTADVQVTQVFGGGHARWVNEFGCVRR